MLLYAVSDLAGPFSMTMGRNSAKLWICLFVCMVTTAIFDEVAVDLTGSTFINVFQRILCFTGFRTKRTDNGMNFDGANNILRREIIADLEANFQKIAK